MMFGILKIYNLYQLLFILGQVTGQSNVNTLRFHKYENEQDFKKNLFKKNQAEVLFIDLFLTAYKLGYLMLDLIKL